eukprot:scaffold2599_cov125-Cylindrotheca_fusiformis.AAC.16
MNYQCNARSGITNENNEAIVHRTVSNASYQSIALAIGMLVSSWDFSKLTSTGASACTGSTPRATANSWDRSLSFDSTTEDANTCSSVGAEGSELDSAAPMYAGFLGGGRDEDP